MARNCFHLDADNFQSAFNSRPASDFTDILQMIKCTVFDKPSRPLAKRNYSRNIGKFNSLEIIPETNNNLDNNNVQAENGVILECGNEINAQCEHPQVIEKDRKLSKDLKFDNRDNSVDNSCPAQSDKCNNLNVHQSMLRPETEKRATSSSLSGAKSTWQQNTQPNHRSAWSNPDLKSGVLVWLSQGDRSKSLKKNSTKSAIDNDSINHFHTNRTNTVLCRIPVMLKIYRRGPGSFAVMTPSRSYHGQMQPICLRLKNSHVIIMESPSMPIDSAKDGPCCFFLTLNNRDGESFKFEASSKTAALEWMQVLSTDAAETTCAPAVETSLPSTQLGIQDGINISHSPTDSIGDLIENNDNKKNNNDDITKDTKIIDVSGLSTQLSTLEKHPLNQPRLAQSNPAVFTSINHHFSSLIASQKDRRMPTVSESSDENEEDWSDED